MVDRPMGSLLTLALGSLLAACGGGSGPSAEPLAAAALSAPHTAPARPAMATADAELLLPLISPEEVARQLLDEAERRFPTLFASGPASALFGGYVYRHYPSTGVYLGVALGADQGQVPGHVYGLGGSFGATPVDLGPVGQHLSPTVQRIGVPLTARGLVADAARGVYYASVPASVVGSGNRVATIDAASGRVSLSGPVGSDPAALALAADGQSLYVALRGSGEVLRLALPGMTSISRTRLPADGFFGQSQVDRLSASPTDAGTVAASLQYGGVSPRHAGVALIRNGVLQARVTQGHTGSNEIAFGADGLQVFGLNNESTEFGLRRLAVLADGLQEERVVAAGSGFGASLRRIGSSLIAGSSVWSTPDLLLQATLPVSGPCDGPDAGRAVCLDTSGSGAARLVIVDLSTGTQLRQLALPVALDSGATPIWVVGPGPRIARVGETDITIVRDEMLR